MGEPSTGLKIGSVIWAIVISIVTIVLGAALILPSTKKAHFDFRKNQPETAPSTQP